jgi:hypothetical protein
MKHQKKFKLLKEVPNYLDLNIKTIRHLEIDNGPRKIFVILELIRKQIDHYTKQSVFNFISNIKLRKKLHVIKLKSYILPIAYNRKTDGIIFNLSAFGVDDIYPNNPGAYNVYSSLVYGLCLRHFSRQKNDLDTRYYQSISNYLISIIMRMFGKSYGLLGSFSDKIPTLKFLINSYVLNAFFDITGIKNYRMASKVSHFDYRNKNIEQYDLSNIFGLIDALSEMKVFPGLNKYMFVSKIMKTFTFNFLPALEDPARFISTIAASNIKGNTIFPTFISKYNEKNYEMILNITKSAFK